MAQSEGSYFGTAVVGAFNGKLFWVCTYQMSSYFSRNCSHLDNYFLKTKNELFNEININSFHANFTYFMKVFKEQINITTISIYI